MNDQMCDNLAPPMPVSATATILMIDDDAPLRMLVERYLSMFGYRPLVAADGEEGVRIAAEHPEIDLIILDVVMPGISARELAERLTGLLPQAQILFCSGHPRSALERLGIDLKGAQFMQKPCRPLVLKEHLREMLAARSEGRWP